MLGNGKFCCKAVFELGVVLASFLSGEFGFGVALFCVFVLLCMHNYKWPNGFKS